MSNKGTQSRARDKRDGPSHSRNIKDNQWATKLAFCKTWLTRRKGEEYVGPSPSAFKNLTAEEQQQFRTNK